MQANQAGRGRIYRNSWFHDNRHAARLARNDRQHYVGQVSRRVINGIARDVTGHLIDVTAAGVEIPVEAREIAARDLESNAMTGVKVGARSLQIDRDFVDLTGLHARRLRIAVAIAGALNTILDVI